MNRISFKDVTINYRSVGVGENVVLIHGLATNHSFWHLSVLRSLSMDYRVTTYDLRGHGYSNMTPSGYTSSDMIEDLHNLLNHLGISNAHLIGHSFGGVVALHYAAVYPEQVVSLTIADSRVRSVQPYQKFKDWQIWKVLKEKFEELSISISDDETEAGISVLEQLALYKLRNKGQISTEDQLFIPLRLWGSGNRSAEQWIRLLQTTTAKKDLTSLSGLTLKKLSTINQPTLTIYGEKSSVLQSFQGLRKYLPSCKAIIVPHVGHFFPISRPKIFIKLVKQFLLDVDYNRQTFPHGVKSFNKKYSEILK